MSSSLSIVSSSIAKALQEHTSIFGIRLWVVILSVLFILFLIFTTLSFCVPIFHYRRCRQESLGPQFSLSSPYALKANLRRGKENALSSGRRLLLFNASGSEAVRDFSMGKQMMELEGLWSSHKRAPSGVSLMGDVEAFGVQVQSTNIGWTRFSVDEIEAATSTFAMRNLIGYGETGVVYHGVLFNGTRVAVKRLLNNSYEDDEELKLELDALMNIAHKNIVKLLGFCLEGDDRMLIYEYIDMGNLYWWLHVRDAKASALTWDRRMTIIHGAAKGLAYLHEGINPGIVHGNIKSSNIVLDQQWNPKISDIGSALPFGPGQIPRASLQHCYGTQGTGFGEISAEKNTDVYCFGILIMEIVTGRLPVDESKSQIVYLIDSVKYMIANQEVPRLLDPRIPNMPPLKDLKRILLIALMCVDLDPYQRPDIGRVVCMLETPSLVLLENASI